MSDILDEVGNIKPTDNTIPYVPIVPPKDVTINVRFEDWVTKADNYIEANIDRPRMFAFNRDEDVHGVSGVGTVAYGIQFSDGTVAMHWVGNVTSTSVWTSMAALITVHGHDGKSQVQWL